MAVGPVSSARSALHLAQTKLAASAHNTANALTDGFRRTRVDAVETAGGGVRPEVSRATTPGNDLVGDAVERITAGVLYRANLAVIEADDAMTGDLLDTIG